MATTPYAIPPSYQIAKYGTTTLQATDAMALWMQSLTNQAASALDRVPAGTVTHTGTTIPENAIVLGSGSSTVTPLPNPDTTDLVLVSSGAGQAPRWLPITAIQVRAAVAAAADTGTMPPPELTAEQQQIINHIVFLLHELVRITKAS